MKLMKLLLSFFIFGFFFTSCSNDDEPIIPEVENLEVEEFIYRGLNDYYLYKSDVAALANDYFSDATEKRNFLADFGGPEKTFKGLLAPQDEFSFMFADYVELENLFKGVIKTTGMDYGLSKFSNSDGVFAYVRYVLPGTSAEKMGIERGDLFTTIDGVEMNLNNYSDLLAQDSYTITLATIANNTISQTDEKITLENREYDENPVNIAKVIEQDGVKIGYLMYNSFTSDYDAELNQAFADFNAAGVTELILDLRYNGGGSTLSALRLASMITGQFTNKVFAREQWNEKYQNLYKINYPESLILKFTDVIDEGQALNSLNLNEINVITTGSSASASELVINGLEPYINVNQIGTTTRGKFQGSVTLYDSPNFRKKNVNPNHRYALQPLVFKIENVEGKSDYLNGLAPDISIKEDLANMGTLGDASEPLLNAAINSILGNTNKRAYTKAEFPVDMIGESGMELPNYQNMYTDKLPALPENLK